MSTGSPWHPWGDPHFSPKPQPNPMRVVPMTGPRFQSPSPCPEHKLGTWGRRGSGRKKDLFYSRHWSHFLSLNFLLWPNSRLRTHNQGGLWSSPKAKNQPSITLSIWKIDPYILIMPRCPMALLGRDLLSKLGVFITIPPQYSLYILHTDGT